MSKEPVKYFIATYIGKEYYIEEYPCIVVLQKYYFSLSLNGRLEWYLPLDIMNWELIEI